MADLPKKIKEGAIARIDTDYLIWHTAQGTETELKLLYFVASLTYRSFVQRPEPNILRISRSDFIYHMKDFGIRKKYSISDLNDMVAKLSNVSFAHYDILPGDKQASLSIENWFKAIRQVHNENNNYFDFFFNEESLAKLESNAAYTRFYGRELAPLNSKYAIQLFSHFKAKWSKQQKANIKRNKVSFTYSLNELKHNILKIPKNEYKEFYEFKRRVLIPAQQNICMATDIYVWYEFIKQGRTISDIKFNITEDYTRRKLRESKTKSLRIDFSAFMNLTEYEAGALIELIEFGVFPDIALQFIGMVKELKSFKNFEDFFTKTAIEYFLKNTKMKSFPDIVKTKGFVNWAFKTKIFFDRENSAFIYIQNKWNSFIKSIYDKDGGKEAVRLESIDQAPLITAKQRQRLAALVDSVIEFP